MHDMDGVHSSAKDQEFHSYPGNYEHRIYLHVYPPSTTISAPVVYVLASLARYKYTPFSSRGSASRLNGVKLNHSSFISKAQSAEMAVSIYPGLTQFTRPPHFAHSTARDLVKWMTPALHAL